MASLNLLLKYAKMLGYFQLFSYKMYHNIKIMLPHQFVDVWNPAYFGLRLSVNLSAVFASSFPVISSCGDFSSICSAVAAHVSNILGFCFKIFFSLLKFYFSFCLSYIIIIRTVSQSNLSRRLMHFLFLFEKLENVLYFDTF